MLPLDVSGSIQLLYALTVIAEEESNLFALLQGQCAIPLTPDFTAELKSWF